MDSSRFLRPYSYLEATFVTVVGARMTEKRPISELLEAYRSGDETAREQLLGRLESELRSLTRRLVGRQIRSERESMDVCQSLLLAFHLRASDGKIEIENDAAFRGYLRSMIRHKLAGLSDRIRAKKRGGGRAAVPLRTAGEEEEGVDLPSLDPSASVVARTSELRGALIEALSKEELRILEGRLAGRTNVEIADALGKTPDAVRMAWGRARKKLEEKGLLRSG
jgi:RNA polymerase sigma factor (sigma-70 family)